MIVGCYDLRLYCGNGLLGTNSVDHEYGYDDGWEFPSNSKRQSWRAAKKAGWVFRNGDAYCPKCKKRVAPPREAGGS